MLAEFSHKCADGFAYINSIALYAECINEQSAVSDVGLFILRHQNSDNAFFAESLNADSRRNRAVLAARDTDNGEITGFKMRCKQSKLTTVKALQSIGYDTIASGDSFNDLGMIKASKAGFLFRSTDAIKAEYPQFPAFETYDELLDAIKKAMD